MNITKHSFAGHEFYFYSTPTLPDLINEIFHDNYKIFEKELKFNRGDLVLDVGANEGVFSILLAKCFPGIEIVSIEAVPRTFYQMIRNIGLNCVSNITPVNIAVGGEPGSIDMVVSDVYSGGSSSVVNKSLPHTHVVSVDVDSLDNVVKKYGYGRKVKLLKMDIEGAEYETLYKFNGLGDVENFVGEIHINNHLTSLGYKIDDLASFIASRTNLLYYEYCKMSE